jgi:predicted DsbA family dithiol-disulfide isomerase
MKIDFVSDVACPWCIIGLRGLEEALERASDVVTPEIAFQPFELNPDMAFEGEDSLTHFAQKYGSTPDQSAANRAMIAERAAALGFTMVMSDKSRIYNTFDAHRLLHWAGIEGRQAPLKHALFEAYFTRGENTADPDVLVAAAERAGLSADEAGVALASGRYAEDVRRAEQLWRTRGINAVPAIVIDGRYLISGGQPPEAFEQAIRQIAREAA